VQEKQEIFAHFKGVAMIGHEAMPSNSALGKLARCLSSQDHNSFQLRSSRSQVFENTDLSLFAVKDAVRNCDQRDRILGVIGGMQGQPISPIADFNYSFRDRFSLGQFLLHRGLNRGLLRVHPTFVALTLNPSPTRRGTLKF
jgi:hypothetical protein